MSGQEQVTISGAGDCGWHLGSGDSRNGQNLSTTGYGLNKGWTNADSSATPAMSKTAVANLLRQMKGFVSSDVTVEQNEPDEHWGVGEGPVVKGWGQLPQQQLPQQQQQQTTAQQKPANRNHMSNNNQTQILTQRGPPHIVALNKKKASGWCSNTPSVRCYGGTWETPPTNQYSWVSQKTNDAQVREAAVKLANGCTMDSPPYLRTQDAMSYSAPPKISSPNHLQRNTTLTDRTLADKPTAQSDVPKVHSAFPPTAHQTMTNLFGLHRPPLSAVNVSGWNDQSKIVPLAVVHNFPAPSSHTTPTSMASVQATTATTPGYAGNIRKVSAWGAKFTPTAECKPEALRRWTESPPPVSTPPISPDGEPNKMVYVSKWLNDQTASDAPPPPVPVTPPLAASPVEGDSARRNKANCYTQKNRIPRPTSALAGIPQPHATPGRSTNDHLYQMSTTAQGSPSIPTAVPPPPAPSLEPLTQIEPNEKDPGIIVVQSKEQKLSVLLDFVQIGLQKAEQLPSTYAAVPNAITDYSIHNSSSVRVLIVVDHTLWDPKGIRTWLSMCSLMKEPDVSITTTKELEEGACATYCVAYLINFDLLGSLEEYVQRLRLLDQTGSMKTLFDPLTESESAQTLASQLKKCGFSVPQELVPYVS